jgi:hypothetical protein
LPGATGPQGLAGAQGAAGAAGCIKSVSVLTCSSTEIPYCYNEGSPEQAELVLVLPEGAAGATGPTGPQGAQGLAGQCVHTYGGMFNTEAGEFEVTPDEIIAMTFSDFLPAAGMWYDEHHSVVLNEAGVYELHYALRAQCMQCGTLQMALTNDGAIIPSSQVTRSVAADGLIDVSGAAMTAARAGAHLHFVLFTKDSAKISLNEGVNLQLHVKRLG